MRAQLIGGPHDGRFIETVGYRTLKVVDPVYIDTAMVRAADEDALVDLIAGKSSPPKLSTYTRGRLPRDPDEVVRYQWRGTETI